MSSGRKLIFWPDPILRKKADQVRIAGSLAVSAVPLADDVYAPGTVDWGFVEDDDIGGLIDDMLITMRGTDGIGLAASQIGVAKRIITIDLPESMGGSGPVVMINPEIISASVEQSRFGEGCLSFPEQQVDVVRPSIVTVSYVSAYGRINRVELSGLHSVCVQHEIDHTNGKVIIDHTDYIRRQVVERSLKKVLRS